MKILRTPESRFAGLPDFGYEPRYADVGAPGEPVRMAFVSAGPVGGPVVVLLHGDPITAGADRPLRELVPGARGQEHVTIRGGGHFVQEDRGEELARVVASFVSSPS